MYGLGWLALYITTTVPTLIYLALTLLYSTYMCMYVCILRLLLAAEQKSKPGVGELAPWPGSVDTVPYLLDSTLPYPTLLCSALLYSLLYSSSTYSTHETCTAAYIPTYIHTYNTYNTYSVCCEKKIST